MWSIHKTVCFTTQKEWITTEGKESEKKGKTLTSTKRSSDKKRPVSEPEKG